MKQMECLMQRLRLNFSRGEAVKYISHLDIMRLWQRAFVRAGITLAYTEGFNPHPRMAIAAPLALGVIAEAELMDVFIGRYISPDAFQVAVTGELPAGMGINQVLQVSPLLPSLQASLSFAEYEVSVSTDKTRAGVQKDIDNLLALEELPWQHQRDTGPRRYDIRTLVDNIWVAAWQHGNAWLGMRLRCDSGGSGRPEQVTAATGFKNYPEAIHRTRLILRS
ncbi:TIGR03936 family radical SAM-associated protein [Chloroflexota bacterium]